MAEETVKLKLPDKIFVLSDEMKDLFRCLAKAARINGAEDVATDMDWYADGWFYDAQKLLEDVPEVSKFIGKFLIEGKEFNEDFIKSISKDLHKDA